VTNEYPLSQQEHYLRTLEAENEKLLKEIALLEAELRGKDKLIKWLVREVYVPESWDENI